jgi:hypothetical protein
MVPRTYAVFSSMAYGQKLGLQRRVKLATEERLPYDSGMIAERLEWAYYQIEPA